ncbi:hypothetical protein M9Y10_017872 [Tritrichomonas musculus]|uniref:VWFA domain-containing protein n=2 Tax=Tritrichomonas musculus TaxID=1915356 RepID=A0ABR2HVS8_9EUKA
MTSKRSLRKFKPKISPADDNPQTNSSNLPPLNTDKRNFIIDGNHNLQINIKEVKTSSDIIKYLRNEFPRHNVTGFQYNGRNYDIDNDDDVSSFFEISKSYDISLIYTPKPPNTSSSSSSRPSSKNDISSSSNSTNNTNATKLEYPSLGPINIFIESTQTTLAFIDYTKSMSSLFCGIKRTEIATNIINKVKLSFCDYQIRDPFLFYGNEFQGLNKNLINQPELFKNTNSTIFDTINQAVRYFEENPAQQYKRIFFVSDCESDTKEADVIQICNNLLKNNIILDAILLNDKPKKKPTSLLTSVCSMSHITGGIFLIPQKIEDAYSFTELEMLIDLSTRPFSHLTHKMHIGEPIFKRVSENIQYNSPEYSRKRNFTFYHDVILISTKKMKPSNENFSNQINECANKQSSNSFYSIFYLFDDYLHQIDPQKAIVFIKGNDPELVYQILIRFSNDFQKTLPSLFLLSDIKLKNEKSKSNGFIIYDNNKKYTDLVQILCDVRSLMRSSEPDEKYYKLAFGPIKSLDEIDSLFRVCY